MRDLDDLLRSSVAADAARIAGRLDPEAVLRSTGARVVRRRRARVLATTAAALAVVVLVGGVAWGAARVLAAPVPPAGTSGPAVTRASASATPSGTMAGSLFVDVPMLGTLPQADATTLAGATAGWAVLRFQVPGDTAGGAAVDRLVLADPTDGTLDHLLDLSTVAFGGGTLADLSWQHGSTLATAVVSTPATVGTDFSVGTLDLLTGGWTVQSTLTSRAVARTSGGSSSTDGLGFLVGLRHDGALVVVTSGSTPQVVIGTGGTGTPLAVWAGGVTHLDPSGHRMLSDGVVGPAGLLSPDYQVIDLDTGADTRYVWGDGRTCVARTWLDATHVLASCATTGDTSVGRWAPTAADHATLVETDVLSGVTTTLATPAVGDPWLSGATALTDGAVLAVGWPLPGSRSAAADAPASCVSHVYLGARADGRLTEVAEAGGWPVTLLGSAGDVGYLAYNSNGCATSTVGTLAAYDTTTGASWILAGPSGAGAAGVWTQFTTLP